MSHDAGDTERSPLLRNESGTASSFGSTDTLVLDTIKGDAFLVDWVGSDDLGNPQNLHPRRKWLITMALGLYALTTTFASSVFGTATVVMAKEFKLEPFEVEFGCTSLFMVGFAMGPTVWGPSSERFGRKSPLLVAYVAFIILQLPVTLSANPSVIFATRLLQGFTGAAPSSILSGTLADIWSVKQRGVTMAVVGTALGIGPIFGPLVGAMLIEYHLGWRWIGVVTGVGSAFVALMTFPFIPETYAPILLSRRAQELRLLTKNWAYRSRFEEAANEGESFAKKYLLRPAQMLTLEPILLLMSLYISCSFGLLYNFFVAYPASFISERHWTPTLASLPLLLVLSGTIAGGTIMVYTADSRFAPNAAKGRPAEARLLLMMVGAISLPLGIFGFAFCSDIDNAVPQMLFGIPTGLGIQLINMQALNYLVDVYGVYANSAVAANTTLRSLFAAGLPVVARRYLYPSLGVKWATCVLGLVAVSFAPIPVLFYFFGAKIRARSRWVPPVQV